MDTPHAFQEIESDLDADILRHTTIPWTDGFREAENLGALHAKTLGVRSFDLLHVGLAVALKATFPDVRCPAERSRESGRIQREILTFRQREADPV